jgi:hypothetical protein
VHRPQSPAEGDSFTAAADWAGDRPFGPDAAAILSSEHWSLLATRSLIWNEAMSRATVFLTVEVKRDLVCCLDRTEDAVPARAILGAPTGVALEGLSPRVVVPDLQVDAEGEHARWLSHCWSS